MILSGLLQSNLCVNTLVMQFFVFICILEKPVNECVLCIIVELKPFFSYFTTGRITLKIMQTDYQIQFIKLMIYCILYKPFLVLFLVQLTLVWNTCNDNGRLVKLITSTNITLKNLSEIMWTQILVQKRSHFFTPIFSKIDGRGLTRLEGLNYAEFMSQCFTAEQIPPWKQNRTNLKILIYNVFDGEKSSKKI